VKQSNVPKWIHAAFSFILAVFSFIHARHKDKYLSVMIEVVGEDAASSWRELGASTSTPHCGGIDTKQNCDRYHVARVHTLRIALLTSGARGRGWDVFRCPPVEKS